MGNTGRLGISTVVILIAVLLISLTTFTVLSSDTNGDTDTTENDLLEIFQKASDEAVDDITTYLKVMDKSGRYYGPAGNQKIQRIAIMIKPLISKQINLSEITIKISNGENLQILTYSNQPAKITTTNNQIFNHPIWDTLTIDNFTIIATHDRDNSLSQHSYFNENKDMGYIIIKLPHSLYMKKDDKIILQMFPSTGIDKKIILEAPLPMEKLVEL